MCVAAALRGSPPETEWLPRSHSTGRGESYHLEEGERKGGREIGLRREEEGGGGMEGRDGERMGGMEARRDGGRKGGRPISYKFLLAWVCTRELHV